GAVRAVVTIARVPWRAGLARRDLARSGDADLIAWTGDAALAAVLRIGAGIDARVVTAGGALVAGRRAAGREERGGEAGQQNCAHGQPPPRTITWAGKTRQRGRRSPTLT